MYGQLIVFLLAFIVLFTSGLEIKLWNERDCPSTYSIYSSEGQRIDIEIISTSNSGCKNLVVNKRNLKEVPDLKPIIKAVYKNGRYVANITWTFTTKGRKLPKHFLLNTTFYEGDGTSHRYSNNTCISLILTSGRRIRNKKTRTSTTIDFFFDCLPLQGPQHFGLRAEVWIFPRKTVRNCRSVRSIPDGTRRCGTPGVQCSTPSSFGVSLDSHSYRQCVCYRKYHGEPVLTWERDIRSQTYKITVTNLPPYLKSPVEIDVFSADKDDKDQFLETSVFKNDTVEVFTAVPSKGVNYEVYVRVTNLTARLSVTVRAHSLYNNDGHSVYNSTQSFDVYSRNEWQQVFGYDCKDILSAECQKPGRYEKEHTNEIDAECDQDKADIFITRNKQFNNEPVHVDGDERSSTERTEDYLYLVVILTAVILTGVITSITFFCCRRKSCRTLSSFSSPATNSDNGIEMTTRQAAVSLLEHNTGNVNENVDNRQRVYVHEDDAEMCASTSQSQSSPNTNKETYICTREIPRIPVICVQCEKNSNKQDKVNQFMRVLKQTCLVKLEAVRIASDDETNIDDIMGKSDNMIVIMTKGLIDICRNSSTLRRMFHNFELERTRISLHLVSLGDDGESIDTIMQFLSDHGLRESTNCFPYYFVGEHVNSVDNKYVLNTLSKRLCCDEVLDLRTQKAVLDKTNKSIHVNVHGDLKALNDEATSCVNAHRTIMKLNID